MQFLSRWIFELYCMVVAYIVIPKFGDDFIRGTNNDLWGRLMGVPYVQVPPDGTPLLERFWQATWEQGHAPTFESLFNFGRNSRNSRG